VKLAWTRHLLKIRTELADVFASGDYQPLEVGGRHSDHVVAFARRHGRDAAITAVAKSFAAFSQGGRVWPRGEAFDGSIDVSGYSVESFAEADATDLRLSDIFRHFPAAVLKARFAGALKPTRKRLRA
jgi:(1->4)-alpha-D-glucan 1-alpha-D-glucosylmutase